MMRRHMRSICLVLLVIGQAACWSPIAANAQTAENERTFPQSKAIVEKALKELQTSTAGRLPTLEGFAVSNDLSLDRFQRGYFQCMVHVMQLPSGGSRVRVEAKITAWYVAPAGAESGYRVLVSNGRLESDLLDRLQESIGQGSAEGVSSPAPSRLEPENAKAATPPASLPTGPIPDAPSASASERAFHVGAVPPNDEAPSMATKRAVEDRHMESLRTDAKNLEEILHNQSRPTNLVAIKAANTPILAQPNEGAKVLFVASAEDEFEILDLNASWVHVRISGLSRGWILRSRVELSADAASDAASAVAEAKSEPADRPAKTANQQLLQVEHEEIATFPGVWQPLQGKTVKIISVQTTMPTGADSQAKLSFAKSLFAKAFAEMSKEHSTAAGVVVIFDSVDGGMLATTLQVLREWKSGTISDEALWRRCYADPPEMISAAKAE
jgi:hypothetical protein